MKVKTILLLLVLIVCISANIHLNQKYKSVLDGNSALTQQVARQIFQQYQMGLKKSFYRFNIFFDNLKKIKEHNSGNHSWTQGINDFTYLTFNQFKQGILMQPQQNCKTTKYNKINHLLKQKTLPENFDWNDKGMVSPVKRQGTCGSCWAFSTIGAMESHWNILGKGKNLTFSEQQLIDCAGDFNNHGCFGGLPSHAFQYIKYNGGLQSDKTYPYVAKRNKCHNDPQKNVAYCKYGSYNITQGDQKELAQKLYQKGPVSVTFHVMIGFMHYKSGVYNHKDCGSNPQDVNHAVLATGFGIQKGVKFWKAKNSWGTNWGENGYFKIERDVNMCAIAQCNSYPLIDESTDLITLQ